MESYAIGRPCTASCKYGRQCGANITPALLKSAHERSYGRSTTRIVVNEEENSFVFNVECKKSETMQRWRRLAAESMSRSNDGERRLIERLTVCNVGPVCQDYWSSAYGIPQGTANLILAEARAGRIDVDLEQHQTAKDITSAMRLHTEGDALAAEMTVQWWELWLSLEDQMPNEATIQHRTVVWNTVYELEYIPDIEWWGICRALSRSRWVHLRGVALRNLSIQYFGHVEGSPDEPLAMLSLLERPKHSNFGMCIRCAEAKDKWIKYRR